MNNVKFYKRTPSGGTECVIVHVTQRAGEINARRRQCPTVAEANRTMLAKGYSRRKPA